MPVLDLAAFRAALCPAGALIGLDVGSKTVGVAVSDPGRCVGSPLTLLRRGKFATDATELERHFAARRAIGWVLGLPVSLDGTEGPRCQSVRQFAANLLARADCPLLFWDERFSTAAIERFLIEEADMTRARRGEVIDKMAAAYILQGALDALARPDASPAVPPRAPPLD